MNSQEKQQLNNRLSNAISTYDFQEMKETLKVGADVDNMILHRVINHDRVDWLDYFLYSPELHQHCDIHYEYSLFGKQAASFSYACSCGAIEVVKYMLNDSRISGGYNFSEVIPRGFMWACEGGSIEVVEFLKQNPATGTYCDFSLRDFSPIKQADKRKRHDFLSHLIITLPDFELVSKIVEKLETCRASSLKAYEVRLLEEKLRDANNSSSLQGKSSKTKPKV